MASLATKQTLTKVLNEVCARRHEKDAAHTYNVAGCGICRTDVREVYDIIVDALLDSMDFDELDRRLADVAKRWRPTRA